MIEKLKRLQEKNVYRNTEQINVLTALVIDLYNKIGAMQRKNVKSKKAKK